MSRCSLSGRRTAHRHDGRKIERGRVRRMRKGRGKKAGESERERVCEGGKERDMCAILALSPPPSPCPLSCGHTVHIARAFKHRDAGAGTRGRSSRRCERRARRAGETSAAYSESGRRAPQRGRSAAPWWRRGLTRREWGDARDGWRSWGRGGERWRRETVRDRRERERGLLQSGSRLESAAHKPCARTG